MYWLGAEDMDVREWCGMIERSHELTIWYTQLTLVDTLNIFFDLVSCPKWLVGYRKRDSM